MNFYLMILASIILSCASAQKELSKNYIGSSLWLGYYPSVRLSKKITLQSDFQYRNSQPFSKPFLFLGRTGMAYKIKENLSISMGYALFSNFLSTNEIKKENRFWQEIYFRKQNSVCNISARVRSEQRFFETSYANKIVYFKKLVNRIRWKTEIDIPISKTNDSFVVLLSNEIMFSTNNIKNWFFDQNRFIIGANIKLYKLTFISPQFLYLFQNNNNKVNSSTIARLNILQKF